MGLWKSTNAEYKYELNGVIAGITIIVRGNQIFSTVVD